MANHKDRIEELEKGLGFLTDEFHNMRTGIGDKLRGLDESHAEKFRRLEESNKSMEDTIRRMMDMMTQNRANVPPRPEIQQPPELREEVANVFPAPANQHRQIKLDCPRFDGGDPTEWLSKIKQYFTFHEIPMAQRVSFASYHLTSEANSWWQAISKALRLDPNTAPWETFEHELWVRFGPSEGENFHEALSKIRQTGSLREYQKEFERLMNKTDNWSEAALVGTFLGGLKDSIADNVRMFSPTTLRAVINLARLRDDQLQRQRKSFTPRTFSPSTTAPTVSTVASPPNFSPRDSPVPKKLSWEEMKRKRSLGLCFSCDERYTPGHRCRKSQLLLMEGEDIEEEDDEVFHEAEGPEISLQALTGWDTPRTLRVLTMVNHRQMVALIDSGSTHNFISEKAANRLNLKLTPTTPFSVKVADGHPLRCRGSYRNVTTELGGVSFRIEFFVLPLTGLDVVLGIQWLETLGPIVCDWKAHYLKFMWAGEEKVVHGLQTKTIAQAHTDEIRREAKMGQACFALSLHEANDAVSSPIAPDMSRLLHSFERVFQTPTSLPPNRDIEHRIVLKEGTDPINVRPYRYAHFQKEEIERQVQEMLDSGLIRPSSSPFSSPVLLVKKKDGSWRFCTDYRALNAATVKDRFPIPTVDDMLDELHGSMVFTKLDLTAGYHQVRVHPPDIPKTAFRTHNGHYEYMVMPFGLCNAPSTFQSLMNAVFRPHLRKFVLVFFDDILVYSRSWEDHVEHVRVVLQILAENNLFVKRKKCEFGKTELEYLGHIISGDGVKVDQEKIRAMIDWPPPTTITELRGFLGLTGYYRKFVRDYGIIARPLTNLLKKGKFEWTHDAETAFQTLKTAMTSTPTLAMPDFDNPFIIQTDASGEGIGAILTQNGKPLAFMSRSLGVAKRNWSTYAREMLAIVIAIRTWRPYLLGRKFTIQTDQKSLRFLLEQRILTPEQQKWMGKLVGYDYEITYKPGSSNAAADALSRRGDSPRLDSISVQHTVVWDELRKLAKSDPYLLKIGHLADTSPGQPYTRRNGLLCYHNRVVIPPASSLIPTLLHEYHDTLMGGHSGILRTFKRLSPLFYWPGMHKTIRDYVAACDVCQRAKYESLSPAGLLQPLPVPERIWEDVSMDFVDGLPTSNHHTTIMVVVDRLSKAAHLVPLSHPYTAKSVAAKFVEFIVKLHGVPRSIVSDRDPVFTSDFWKELWRTSGTKLCMSSAYHPQTDGQTEVVNRIIEQFLRCFVADRPKQWSFLLPWAEYWYNTTFHSSTGMSPFKATFGRDPPPLVGYESGTSPLRELDEQLLERDEILRELKAHLQAANNRMKQAADAKRRDVHFQVGDWVFLRLQPHRQHTIFKRTSQKLSTKYFGPFQVEECIGPVAYRLKLPEGTRVHSVFHVSLLKKRVGSDTPTSGSLPPLRSSGFLRLRPEQVLQFRDVTVDGKKMVEALVKWQDLPLADATWEDYVQLKQSFPTLNLVDKVLSDGGSNDAVQDQREVTRRSNRCIVPNRRYLQ